MDTGKLRDRIASASNEELEKIQAYLQAEQAERDQERAERERLQADLDQERAERERRQAKWQMWQVWASVATVGALLLTAVTVFGSIFALRQGSENLRLQREAQASQQQAALLQDEESRYSSVYGKYLDMEKTISDHPDLVSCFYNTHCDRRLNPQEDAQASILAVYIADFYQYLYSELRTINNVENRDVPPNGEFVLRKDNTAADESWITWSETIVDAFKGSTMVCDTLKASADAYSTDFRHALAQKNACPGLEDPGV